MVLITIVTGVYIQTYANIYANHATETDWDSSWALLSGVWSIHFLSRPSRNWSLLMYTNGPVFLFSCFPVLGLAGWLVGCIWHFHDLFDFFFCYKLAIHWRRWAKRLKSSPQRVHRSPFFASFATAQSVFMGCSTQKFNMVVTGSTQRWAKRWGHIGLTTWTDRRPQTSASQHLS